MRYTLIAYRGDDLNAYLAYNRLPMENLMFHHLETSLVLIHRTWKDGGVSWPGRNPGQLRIWDTSTSSDCALRTRLRILFVKRF